MIRGEGTINGFPYDIVGYAYRDWLGKRITITMRLCPFRDEEICLYIRALELLNRYDDVPGSAMTLVLLAAIFDGMKRLGFLSKVKNRVYMECLDLFIEVDAEPRDKINPRIGMFDDFDTWSPLHGIGFYSALSVIRASRDALLAIDSTRPDGLVKTYDFGGDPVVFRVTYANWVLDVRVDLHGFVYVLVPRGLFPESTASLVSRGLLQRCHFPNRYRVPYPDELQRILMEMKGEAYRASGWAGGSPPGYA